MTRFTVDYQLEGQDELLREQHVDRTNAERRARELSEQYTQEDLLVYVYRTDNPTGQRSYFHGSTDAIEGTYLDD